MAVTPLSGVAVYVWHDILVCDVRYVYWSVCPMSLCLYTAWQKFIAMVYKIVDGIA